ncbi:hypothetical protein BVI1335_2770010 [Burkholderia vietnamiensis]|nr:hypothetical protein BVI1335_2770010 [Burkholderia vietnamiensis]
MIRSVSETHSEHHLMEKNDAKTESRGESRRCAHRRQPRADRLHHHARQAGQRRDQRVEASGDRRERRRNAVAPVFHGQGLA